MRQSDELGELAGTFNEMVAGLRDRERVHAELERAERLKRFFSPQLAEALSAGDESVLASHRREITVIFCDLRGFTAFAEAADPGEVMRLLRDYHAILGPLIARYEGTLERFTGDGLMVFFNDPVPCPDPALRAVRMAVEARDACSPCWRAGGGGGTRWASAPASRWDSPRWAVSASRAGSTTPPSGSVTNLSGRLCQEATDGQILIAASVYAEVERFVEAVPLGELTLRGFARPLLAFSVLNVRAHASRPPAASARLVRRRRARSMRRRLSAHPCCVALAVLAAGGTAAGDRAPGQPSRRVVTDQSGKPVLDAVVSLTRLAGPPPATPPDAGGDGPGQQGVRPSVLPVVVGTPVSFPNRDNIRHHVYSFSPAKKFELPLYIGTPAAPVVFDKPGPVALGCNIHDWMVAYVYVVDDAPLRQDDRRRQGAPGGIAGRAVRGPRLAPAAAGRGGWPSRSRWPTTRRGTSRSPCH